MLCETEGVVRFLESRYSGEEDVPWASANIAWVSGICESATTGSGSVERVCPISSILPWELCVLKSPEEVRKALSDEVVDALFV